MNNPFQYVPAVECQDAFNKLVNMIESIKKSSIERDIRFIKELESGKMLGVMICENKSGEHQILYAFSGQIGSEGFNYPGFVGPVFDYLDPSGYFKKKEKEISAMNVEISEYEQGFFNELNEKYIKIKEEYDRILSELKDRNLRSKIDRAAIRERGVSDEENSVMIRQSQFEKAEFRRLRKRVDDSISPLKFKLNEAGSYLKELKERRHRESEKLQGWLFDNFKVLNAIGESRSLSEIFASTPLKTPPSGAGECCAPKLLQAAYRRGWKPLKIAEYWYGNPSRGEVRVQGKSYPACGGKCLPILEWMLKGLIIEPPLNQQYESVVYQEPEILFENEWFCVVNKPSGMLSVPGKGKEISLEEWLRNKYGNDKIVRMAHRLDQATSGLIIGAFGDKSYRALQKLFSLRKIKKSYIAILDGDFKKSGLPDKGRIILPLSPDWFDRPRQLVDFEGGKEAMTDYEFLSVEGGKSRVEFVPLTGRTHQLRVHAASELGLGIPISGDMLYGKRVSEESTRMLLHAKKIAFTFPLDGQYYSFESSPGF